jgi:hypothetical protein|uniref:Secreted protein n=1 Tax=Picea glauca TaxID=3330 RepID=A0A101LVA4_PICGL|nr:hypothetical protein ABT39_MTgene2079 [Picea glauca]QHR87103.1 hypothetical protein Q903MT_gene1112 [Picea sitchensis]
MMVRLLVRLPLLLNRLLLRLDLHLYLDLNPQRVKLLALVQIQGKLAFEPSLFMPVCPPLPMLSPPSLRGSDLELGFEAGY